MKKRKYVFVVLFSIILPFIIPYVVGRLYEFNNQFLRSISYIMEFVLMIRFLILNSKFRFFIRKHLRIKLLNTKIYIFILDLMIIFLIGITSIFTKVLFLVVASSLFILMIVECLKPGFINEEWAYVLMFITSLVSTFLLVIYFEWFYILIFPILFFLLPLLVNNTRRAIEKESLYLVL